MACAKHPGAPARERCSRCAAALCQTCLNESVSLGSTTFCPDCAPEALRENLREAEITRKWAANAAALCSVLMAAGLIGAFVAYRAGGENGLPAATTVLVLFFGLARLSSVWAETEALRRACAVRGISPKNPRHEALAKIMAAVLFGIFVAPWTTLRLVAIMRHAEKEIRNSRDLLAEYAQ